MLVLEGKCPKCFGNLVLGEEDMSLTCEDCDYNETTSDKIVFAAAIEKAEEWGPKEKRFIPTEVGGLVLEPFGGLMVFLRETLKEAARGLDLEDSELNLLKRYKLIKEESNDG